jgi:hypothetical protein
MTRSDNLGFRDFFRFKVVAVSRHDHQRLFAALVQHDDAVVRPSAGLHHCAARIHAVGRKIVQRDSTEVVITDRTMETTGCTQPTQSTQEIAYHSAGMLFFTQSHDFFVPARHMVYREEDIHIGIANADHFERSHFGS